MISLGGDNRVKCLSRDEAGGERRPEEDGGNSHSLPEYPLTLMAQSFSCYAVHSQVD